jgi:excisionase family DNA binding protein
VILLYMGSKTTVQPPDYMSVLDTAEYLKVTPRAIRSMIADGRLRAYKLGPRIIRLRRDEIDAALTPFGGDGVA